MALVRNPTTRGRADGSSRLIRTYETRLIGAAQERSVASRIGAMLSHEQRWRDPVEFYPERVRRFGDAEMIAEMHSSVRKAIKRPAKSPMPVEAPKPKSKNSKEYMANYMRQRRAAGLDKSRRPKRKHGAQLQHMLTRKRRAA
jgi:hypothetical protein